MRVDVGIDSYGEGFPKMRVDVGIDPYGEGIPKLRVNMGIDHTRDVFLRSGGGSGVTFTLALPAPVLSSSGSLWLSSQGYSLHHCLSGYSITR